MFQPIPVFGRCLTEARLKSGFSKTALGRLVDLKSQDLSRLELANRDPRWATIYKLIVWPNLPLEEFFPAEIILAAAARLKR